MHGAVALTGGDPTWMQTAWFPWKTTDDGEVLIHLSSIPAAHKAGMLNGFTPEARKLWRAYAAECKRSYMPAKIVPDGDYNWPGLLTREWKPRAYQLAGMDRLYARSMLIGRGSILGDDVGLGKAQPLDAKVLTPGGWTTMGELRVGSRVIGSSGKPIRVLAVYEQGERDVYRVTFNDGAFVECDSEHLWATNTSCRQSRGNDFGVMTTRQISRTLRYRNGQLQHFIPTLSAPVEFKAKRLPLDPYLVGVLLGDGGLTHTVQFSSADDEIVNAVRTLIPKTTLLRRLSKYDYRIVGAVRGRNPVQDRLSRLGMAGVGSPAKAIPFVYLYSSAADRLSLLQGLMDTDGTAAEDGHAEFCSSSKALASQVIELVESLGGTTRYAIGEAWCRMPDGSRKRGHDRHRVCVCLPRGMCPFRLSRKAARCSRRLKYPPSRAIVSVVRVGRKPCRCIRVDAADCLYVTDRFLLTHNTVMAIGTAERIRQEKGWTVIVVTTLSTLSQWKDEIERFAARKPTVVMADGEGAERERRLALPHDWLLMSYETVRLPRFAHLIRKLKPGVLILDEAFKAANPRTTTHAEVAKLADRSMVVLPFNATPLENSLVDVYGQLRLIDRSIMGSLSGFSSRYLVTEGERVVGVKRIREFRVRAAAAMLRRSARECGAEVPKVVAEVHECPMGKAQGAAYVAAIGEFLSDRSTGAVVRTKIARARYAAFAADIGDPASPSSKMDELETLLANELAGQRVIVISRFRRVIEFAAARLRARKPWIIHGDTPQSERADIRRRFNSRLGRGRILLGTEAIERGLNLQSAGVLVNLDLPWNAARLRQRVGRIARIGQTRERVLVLNLSATLRKMRTVDDWLVRIVAAKRGVFDAVYGDDGTDELGKDEPSVEAMRRFLSGSIR